MHRRFVFPQSKFPFEAKDMKLILKPLQLSTGLLEMAYAQSLCAKLAQCNPEIDYILLFPNDSIFDILSFVAF